MLRARGPRCVYERVVQVLLNIIHHTLLETFRGAVAEQTHARRRFLHGCLMARTDGEGEVLQEQPDDPRLVCTRNPARLFPDASGFVASSTVRKSFSDDEMPAAKQIAAEHAPVTRPNGYQEFTAFGASSWRRVDIHEWPSF